MLTRAARAEVLPRNEHTRALVSRAIQYEVVIFRAVGIQPPVDEEPLAESCAHDCLQELLRNDLIGVDVGAIKRRHLCRKVFEGVHRFLANWPTGARRRSAPRSRPPPPSLDSQ